MNAPGLLVSSLYVAIGGALGSWLRFMAGRMVVSLIGPAAAAVFPWATLIVNVAGSFAMGLLAGWLIPHGTSTAAGGESWRLLIGVGLLGGFTTFSAFSLEFATLIERGATAAALLYVTSSLTIGFAALFVGLFAMRALT